MTPALHPKELRIGFGAPRSSGSKAGWIIALLIVAAIVTTYLIHRANRKQKDQGF